MQCAILSWSNVASRVPIWSSDPQTSPQVSTDTLQVVSLVSVGLHLIINQVSPVLPLQGPGRVKWHLKYDPNPPYLSFQESLRDLSMIDFLIMLMHWYHEQGYWDLPLIREGIMSLFRKVAFPDGTRCGGWHGGGVVYCGMSSGSTGLTAQLLSTAQRARHCCQPAQIVASPHCTTNYFLDLLLQECKDYGLIGQMYKYHTLR